MYEKVQKWYDEKQIIRLDTIHLESTGGLA